MDRYVVLPFWLAGQHFAVALENVVRVLPALLSTQLSTFDCVIDTRSPAEFALDHIPGAINIMNGGKFDGGQSTAEEKALREFYRGVLNLSHTDVIAVLNQTCDAEVAAAFRSADNI